MSDGECLDLCIDYLQREAEQGVAEAEELLETITAEKMWRRLED